MISIIFTTFVFIAAGRGENASLPVQLSAVTIEGCSDSCPTTELSGVVNSTKDAIQSLLKNTVVPAMNNRSHTCGGPTPCSCGGGGDWTRIAYVNMNDSTQQCPSGWTPFSTPVRGCTRATSGCSSATFPTNGRSYSHVCGRVIGFQNDWTTAFYHSVIAGNISIEDYVDGVSITHGSSGSRQHIWTLAAALYENTASSDLEYVCPCTSNNSWPYTLPSFIGNNYFCATAAEALDDSGFHADDPLWDGKGCGSTNTCCGFNNPPWFCTTLPSSTTDDIEVRICTDLASSNENVIVDLVDIYVK